MTIREIDALIEETNSLKQITQAFSEIANQKIKKIKADLERNRQFFEEISVVYSLVRAFSLKKKAVLPKPKKRLCLILTSNYRFYGDINSNLIDFFVALTKDVETDRLILGKVAIDYFRSSQIFSSQTELVLKNDQPDPAELINLVNIIKDYNQVLIFYSRFKSLLLQKPVFTDIAAQAKISQEESYNLGFIFEPDLPKILSFFDSQILTLLLEETFLEAEVARTASRFISMDRAETEANKYIKEYQKMRAYTKRGLINSQILENFASMMAIRKGDI